jgi:tripartite-type tricarboxylate transporter receptor subunit TctC
MVFRSCWTALVVLLLWSELLPAASVQDYPVRPLRMVVPYPPGGPNDIFGRLMAQKLSEAFSQQVVVDNRGGASGIIGCELVARAAPDGYTLLLGGAALFSMNPVLFPNLPYDPLQDFAPVSLVASTPLILVTHPALPVKNVQDLVKLAKSKPGQLNFASAGAGGPPRLAAELFKSMTGIDMVHVPYKGGGPALTATLAGDVQLFFPSMAPALPLIKDGKLKGLAVTSAKRTAVVPDFPTIAESGVPGYEIANWFAIVAPAATPKPVIAMLSAAIVKAINSSVTKKRFIDFGADPIGGTQEELAAYIRSELAKWGKVIKGAGIKPE